MKKVVKEKVEKYDVFVATDGREFDNEDDCRAWEKSYKFTIEKDMEKIKKIEVNAISIGFDYASDDYECYVLIPKSIEETIIINAWIDVIACGNVGYNGRVTNDMVGKEVVLNFGYDRDYCDVYTLDGIIEEHRKKIDNVKDLLKEKIEK